MLNVLFISTARLVQAAIISEDHLVNLQAQFWRNGGERRMRSHDEFADHSFVLWPKRALCGSGM